ncbi:MAG TPA: excinuclease ABC subunit UvrC [Candidatus Heimdallarchaeota archaeon]|nr:excinuclease ABC subunit UvrC [Candidatus Heimdallarchaeota archaeon]
MPEKKKRNLKTILEDLPTKPGIYFFKNSENDVIYIGKARSLKDRVKSYFGATSDSKVHNILAETIDIDYIFTDSEKEATFLENNFIQQYQPKFNIRLKDDKAFPYLKVTSQDRSPGIFLTRRVEPDGARYFGPFNPVHQARKTIHLINKSFGIRGCRETIPGKRKRACLEYDLKLCAAPCVQYISESEYRARVEDTLLFLEGKTDKLLRSLKQKMKEDAADEEFERAAQLRDLIQAIEQLKAKPTLISTRQENKDIFGYSTAQNQVHLTVFRMRLGKVIETEVMSCKKKKNVSDSSILSSELLKYYKKSPDFPDKIILPFRISREKNISALISQAKGKKVEMIIPVRGENKKLLELAQKNTEDLARKETDAPSLSELKNLLGLKSMPQRIEGFDISNTGGDESVGSMVVFEEGKPNKSEYRKYKIRTVDGPDDVASLQEVIRRRYASLLTEGHEFMPDLVFVDGGKGQLNAALKALHELGVEDVAVASLAKKEEQIFIPNQKDGLRLKRTSPALKLLQNIRDEAHRFAITYHRRRRTKKSFASPLDAIPGIGPKRKKILLTKYKSVGEIKKAPLEELEELVGAKAAQDLLFALKS